MEGARSRDRAGRRKIVGAILATLTSALLSACAGAPEASHALHFDARSDKAILVIGTSVNRAQEENVRVERSLSTFWQEYDPGSGHLVPEGKTFITSVVSSSFTAEPAYLKPTVSVLEIDPGDYALVGAGFPHKMALYVSPRPTNLHNGGPGDRRSWNHTVDPRVHIDPAAAVDPRRNVLFSVSPGQIVYLGHFQFIKWDRIDSLVRIDYSQDEAAAEEALKAFPGISGTMITYDPRKPPQSVSR